MAALCQEDVDVDGVDKGSVDQSAWSVSCTRMLIEFYKGNRILWDKMHKGYGNKTKTNKVLTPLVAKFQKASPPRTLNEIKKRWHGLRSCALRYLRKSDHDNIKWTFWSDLSFLRESVAEEETASEPWSSHDIGKFYSLNLQVLFV